MNCLKKKNLKKSFHFQCGGGLFFVFLCGIPKVVPIFMVFIQSGQLLFPIAVSVECKQSIDGP